MEGVGLFGAVVVHGLVDLGGDGGAGFAGGDLKVRGWKTWRSLLG